MPNAAETHRTLITMTGSDHDVPAHDSYDQRIGRRIAALRDAAGLTQSDLARRLRITQSAVSRIETGQRGLSAAQVSSLAQIFAVDPGALLTGAGASSDTFSGPLPDSSPGRRGDAATRRPRASRGLMAEVEAVLASDDDTLRRMRQARVEAAGFDAELPATPSVEVSSGPRAESWPTGDDDRAFRARANARAFRTVDFARSQDAAIVAHAPDAPDATAGRATFGRSDLSRTWCEALEPAIFGDVVEDWFDVARRAPELVDLPAVAAAVAAAAGEPAAAANDPVRLARFWRHELGAGGDGPLPDLIVLLEAVGVQVVTARLNEECPHAACVVIAPPAAASPVPFIFLNTFGRTVALQRFALAHELGHLALSHREAYDERIDWSGRNRREAAATAFANEFVAPLAAVRHWADVSGPAVTGAPSGVTPARRTNSSVGAETPNTPGAARRRDPSDDVTTVINLANHFGVDFWAARHRAAAAGLITSPARLRELDRALRARESETIPRQLFLGGLRDTLSVLSAEEHAARARERAGDDGPDPLRIAPQGVRVPGPLRSAVLRLLDDDEASLEEAAGWLRHPAAGLLDQLSRFEVE